MAAVPPARLASLPTRQGLPNTGVKTVWSDRLAIVGSRVSSTLQRHQSRIRKEPVMEKGTTFVGLDVHKEAINVAMLLPGESRAVEWQTSNDPAAVRRLVRKLRRSAVGELRLCYEAGPCGYAVQRTVQGMGESCMVVAPSL